MGLALDLLQEGIGQCMWWGMASVCGGYWPVQVGWVWWCNVQAGRGTLCMSTLPIGCLPYPIWLAIQCNTVPCHTMLALPKGYLPSYQVLVYPDITYCTYHSFCLINQSSQWRSIHLKMPSEMVGLQHFTVLKTLLQMDVALWDKHWIEMSFDGIWWYSMVFNGIWWY